MDRFDVDRKTIDFLYRLYKSGRINVQPSYQRTRVWSDDLRYNLIDSLMQEFPIGLIMLNVVPHVDEDGAKVDKYDVVDGQQRMRSLFEYLDGQGWAASSRVENFKPFSKHSAARQVRFMEYQIPVAFMKEFEAEEITECYNRLQKGKALKIGEKLKSLTTSKVHRFIEELTRHRIFEIGHEGASVPRHKVRDSHWTLATAFFKSIYQSNLLGRQEYKHLSEFFRTHIDQTKASKVLEQCRRILNFQYKMLEEAIKEDAQFKKYAQTARGLKWPFVCIATLMDTYSISGREHMLAKGLLAYYKLIASEGSPEWTAYVNTGRTGRIDTREVKVCLVDLTNQLITAAQAEPLDRNRYFTQERRKLIFENSGRRCAECNIELSLTNFHADHIKPHSQGGPTTVGNGRALCSKCNREKGSSWNELFEASAAA